MKGVCTDELSSLDIHNFTHQGRSRKGVHTVWEYVRLICLQQTPHEKSQNRFMFTQLSKLGGRGGISGNPSLVISEFQNLNLNNQKRENYFNTENIWKDCRTGFWTTIFLSFPKQGIFAVQMYSTDSHFSVQWGNQIIDFHRVGSSSLLTFSKHNKPIG